EAKLGPEHADVAGTLANLGRCLLKKSKYVEAEPTLRESLRVYEQKLPDSWLRFRTLSLLGESLLGQKKYAQAEPLLLSGYEEMKRREGKIPPHSKKTLADALERLEQLYDAWGKKENAAECRKRLPVIGGAYLGLTA